MNAYFHISTKIYFISSSPGGEASEHRVEHNSSSSLIFLELEEENSKYILGYPQQDFRKDSVLLAEDETASS